MVTPAENRDELNQLLLQSSPYPIRALLLQLLPAIPDPLLPLVVSIAVRGVYQDVDRWLLETVLARLISEAREQIFGDLFLELQQGEDDMEQENVLVTLAPYLQQPLLDEALARVRSGTDALSRIRMLRALFPHFPEPQRTELQREILRTLRDVSNEWLYDDTLSQLAPELGEPLFREAIELAHMVERPERRAKLFMTLAEKAPEALRTDLWQVALRTVNQVGEARNWAEIQVGTLPSLPAAQWHALLPQVIQAINAIGQPRVRQEAWLRVYALLTEQLNALASGQGGLVAANPLFATLEPSISALASARDRAELLGQLAAVVPEKRDSLSQQALDVARTLEDYGERAETLAMLIRLFTGEQQMLIVEEAWATAELLQYGLYRAIILVWLLPFLQGERRETALSVVREGFKATRDLSVRARLLLLFAPSIAEEEREQWAKGLLQELAALSDELAVQALLYLFPLLSSPLRASAQYLVSQALHTKGSLPDGTTLVDAPLLVPLLPFLEQSLKDELVQEMMKRILVSTSPRYKAAYLPELLPHLSPALQGEGLRMLLESLPQLERRREGVREQVALFLQMLPSLTSVTRDETLLQVRQLLLQVQYAHDEVELTLACFPFFEDEERQRSIQHLLEVARSVGDAPYRVLMLLKVLPQLDEQQRPGAAQTTLLLLSTFQDVGARIRSLAALLLLLPEGERLPLVTEVLPLIPSIEFFLEQSRLLIVLAPFLPEERREAETLALLGRMGERVGQDEVGVSVGLNELAPVLKGAVPLRPLLELAGRMPTDYYKVDVLQTTLPELANAGLLQLVRDLTSRAERSPYQLRLLARIDWYLARIQAGAGGPFTKEEEERDGIPLGVIERAFALLAQFPEEEREPFLALALRDMLLAQLQRAMGGGPQRRYISTGFASVEQPGVELSSSLPLAYGQSVYFWLEIGDVVRKGAIDDQPTTLPPLEGDVTLKVVLFPLTDGLQLPAAADSGEVHLRDDGGVNVVRQSHVPEKLPEESDLPTHRLFFPLQLPPTGKSFAFLCNIYYGQALLQSRYVRGLLMATPRPVQGALRTRMVYTISPTLDSASLKSIAANKLSLLIDDSSETEQTFCLFGGAGEARFKKAFPQDSARYQDLLLMARRTLSQVCWGSEHDWNGEPYRYEGQSDLAQLQGDLVQLAICGFRMYDVLIGKGGITDDEKLVEGLQTLMREPGFVQIALKQSPRFIPPIALLYDYLLDTNLPMNSYTVCQIFLDALQKQQPLEDLPCFRGACPARDTKTVVCPGGFWGFRHYLGLPLSTDSSLDAAVEIVYQDAPEWLVGAYHDLELREQHLAKMRAFSPLSAWDYAERREEVLNLLAQLSPQLVYFYCHGGVSQSGPYILIGSKDDMGITRDNLRCEKIDWELSRPLVFINGCHTTALEPEKAMEFVSAFVGYAASGVIGTEICVFEPLASQFAEICLGHFLQGLSIGESVRKARVALLQQGNPLGLVYVPFVFPGLRLVKATGSLA